MQPGSFPQILITSTMTYVITIRLHMTDDDVHTSSFHHISDIPLK